MQESVMNFPAKRHPWVWVVARLLETLLVLPVLFLMIPYGRGHFWTALAVTLIYMNLVNWLVVSFSEKFILRNK